MSPRAERTESSALPGSEDGATLVEYALLVMLVALIAVIAITLTGSEVSDTFSQVGSGLQSP